MSISDRIYRKQLISTLEKNPRYRIFYESLKMYDLLGELDRPGVTLFIPTNTSFLNRIEELDNLGDKKICDLLKCHIVPQKLNSLQIGKRYLTLSKKNIVLTGEKRIGDIVIESNPKVFGNVVLYRISDVIC